MSDEFEDLVSQMPPIAPIKVCLRQDWGYDVVHIGKWPRGRRSGQYLRLAERVTLEEAQAVCTQALTKLGLTQFL